MASQLEGVSAREITDEESAHFHEQGWVKFESLISEDEAAMLLERLKAIMGDDGTHGRHPTHGGSIEKWIAFTSIAIDLDTGETRDDQFLSYCQSPAVGRMGAKLLDEPVRFWVDQALVKMPAGQAGSAYTAWHADIGSLGDSPFDPAKQVNVWTALAEVTPEHGAMRFIPAQYITDEVRELCKGRDPEETYAELEAMGIVSPALHLKPGDATAHAASTLHSAPANHTTTPRWAYFMSLFPANATYSGKPFWPMEHVEGIEVGQPFPDHRFPRI